MVFVSEPACSVADTGIERSGNAVVECEIGLAVAVDIACLDDVITGTPEQRLKVECAGAVAHADVSESGVRVVHDKVRFSVAIVIACP